MDGGGLGWGGAILSGFEHGRELRIICIDMGGHPSSYKRKRKSTGDECGLQYEVERKRPAKKNTKFGGVSSKMSLNAALGAVVL